MTDTSTNRPTPTLSVFHLAEGIYIVTCPPSLAYGAGITIPEAVDEFKADYAHRQQTLGGGT